MRVRNTINGFGNISRVELNQEEANILNEKLRMIRKYGGKVTPNKLLKDLSLSKAEEDLDRE